ncbi:MAG: ABC transporter ATP-binding protein [Actinobacteria bacterium]|nr:ABC transporter ATP-binding protein [Actinomycetota bacterium]
MQRPTGPGPKPGLAGMPVEKSKDFAGTTKRLLRQMGPDRVGLYVVLALGLVGVGLQVSGPKVLGHGTNIIFDGVRSRMSGGQGVEFDRLHKTLTIVAVMYLLGGGLLWVQAWALGGVVQRTMQRLRARVETKLHRLPLSYVDSQPRGDLLSRVTNDIDNLSQSLQQTFSQMLTSVLSLIGVLGMMIWISPVLALIALVTIPATLLTMRFIMSRSKKQFIAQWRHTGALNAQVEEVFTGHNLVKVFGRSDDVETTFAAKNAELHQASFKAQFISGIIPPAMMLVSNLNYLLVAVVGGLRVASGQMTLGDVQAFIQYSRQFTQPLTQLASMVNVFQSGVASAERVFEFLDAPEISPEPEPVALPERVQGRIEFDHVEFSYTADKPLIRDLSLTVEPGQTVAIVGPTGAGKTTLVNLIMRFYELNSGQIRLDGVDISTIPRAQLRSHIGMVLQDTWIFTGTIRENLAYGRLDATEADIIEAAKATYVDRFVHSLPDGYDTVLNDDGTSVSAGEKQLLTIARAFLADPSILILDEATSSVDTRTEVLIQKAMAALRSQRTSFVIAHRLSTIRDADIILVMEHGDIVEHGSHEQLLEANGAYARLYNAQFAGSATEVD